MVNDGFFMLGSYALELFTVFHLQVEFVREWLLKAFRAIEDWFGI
jgi:hypothetical protein